MKLFKASGTRVRLSGQNGVGGAVTLPTVWGNSAPGSRNASHDSEANFLTVAPYLINNMSIDV